MKRAIGFAVLGLGIISAPLAGARADTPAVGASFQCEFPIIGGQPVGLDLTTSLPSATLPAGTETGPWTLTAAVVLPPAVQNGYRIVGAASVEVKPRVGLDLTDAAGSEPVRVTPGGIGIPELPPNTVRLSVPNLSPTGPAKLTATDLSLEMTLRDAEGRPIQLVAGADSSDVPCTLSPGSAVTLLSWDPAPTPPPCVPLPMPIIQKFTVAGTTSLTSPKATAQVSGALTLTQQISGCPGIPTHFQLTLDRAKAPFRVFGVLPAEADLQLTATGSTEKPERTLALTAKIPELRLFGIAFAGGDACAAAPSELAYEYASGRLTGTYTLPPLTSCGTLTTIASGLLAGEANTLDLKTTPA